MQKPGSRRHSRRGSRQSRDAVPVVRSASPDEPTPVVLTDEHRRAAAAASEADAAWDDRIPHGLPLPVLSVARLAERLYDAALAPFIDLDDSPASTDEIKRRIASAEDWALNIRSLCTGERRHEWEHHLDNLRSYLYPTLIGIDVSFARELLGTPPDTVASACNASRLIDLSMEDLTGVTSRRELRLRWINIAADLYHRYLSIRIQALLLVEWLRERVRAVQGAMLPLIDLQKEGMRGWTAVVSLAGATRSVHLPNAPALKLVEMIKGKPVSATRSVIRGRSKALCALLPELDPYVTAVGGMRRGSPGSRYTLAPAMAGRITLSTSHG
jgi:hypothetical protein